MTISLPVTALTLRRHSHCSYLCLRSRSCVYVQCLRIPVIQLSPYQHGITYSAVLLYGNRVRRRDQCYRRVVGAHYRSSITKIFAQVKRYIGMRSLHVCEPLTLSAHETRLAIGCIRARGSAKVSTEKQSDGSQPGLWGERLLFSSCTVGGCQVLDDGYSRVI